MIFPTCFGHPDPEESFSYKEVQLKRFCPPVKTSHPPFKNVTNTNVSIVFQREVLYKRLS